MIFRLGRFHKVAGPGWVIMTPVIDLSVTVYLPKKIPEWDRLSEERLHERIKEVYQLVPPKDSIDE
jgi:hypothetical protein